MQRRARVYGQRREGEGEGEYREGGLINAICTWLHEVSSGHTVVVMNNTVINSTEEFFSMLKRP